MRAAAAHALGATGEATNANLQQIVELFKDPEGSVREAAVSAVGATGAIKESLAKIYPAV